MENADAPRETETPPLRVRLVKKRGFLVAEALDPVPPLTTEEVRRRIHDPQDPAAS